MGSEGEVPGAPGSAPAQSRVALVVGATGLVGRELVAQLLVDPDYDEVRVFVRRSLEFSHPKLREQLVDLTKAESFAADLVGEVLFSSLGTTLRAAGSKAAQYGVDHDMNLALAEAAAANRVPAYVLVSSVGATPSALSFYLRMKGKLEQAVSQLSFESIHILRPGILLGARGEGRAGEALALRLAGALPPCSALSWLRPVPVRTVARAMRVAASDWSSGVSVLDAAQIFVLGAE